MAITYTTNLSLAKPPEGHTDWADDINGNFDTLDAESIKYLLLDGESTNVTNGTFDLTTTGTGTFNSLKIEGGIPILVFKDNTDTGDSARGFQEWRDSNNVRLGFFGNSSYTHDDLVWKNESDGGHLLLETTGTGNVGIGLNAPTGQLHVDQSSASGAEPVLRLDQGDIDDTFIDYIGTSAADGTRSISSDTTEEGAKFGAIRCEINGVTKWIRVYDDHS